MYSRYARSGGCHDERVGEDIKRRDVSYTTDQPAVVPADVTNKNNTAQSGTNKNAAVWTPAWPYRSRDMPRFAIEAGLVEGGIS